MKNRMLSLALISLAIAMIEVHAQSTTADSHRIIPIREMTQDVEVLFGDPERSG